MSRDVACVARFLKNSAADLLTLDFRGVKEELLMMRLQLILKLEPVELDKEGV